MGNDANPKILTGSATTTFGAVSVYAVSINKILTGTMTINEGSTAVAQFAIGTGPGTFFNHTNGIKFASLSIVLSANDNVTAITRAG